MKRLGVNIDHIATVRNARGEKYPDPYRAALIAMNSGADSVTIHLREDRRHIKDKDLIKIKRNKKIKLNLEMAPTNEMLKIALKNKPNYVCLVPEKRNEITTEGGLNIKKDFYKIKKIIKILNNAKIRTSLFINPKYKDIKLSYFAGAECVELHTGRFCKLFNEKNIGETILHLINKNLIQTCHDVSIGGILTAVSKMCIRGQKGIKINQHKKHKKSGGFIFDKCLDFQNKNYLSPFFF